MTDFDPGIGDLADRLVAATRAGDHDYVADVLSGLAAGDSRGHTAVLVRDLIGVSARLIVARTAPSGDDLFTFDVTTEHGEPVEVDHLAPGPRAALRALAATLNQDDGDRDTHSALATRGTPAEVVTVLVQCLLWTLELTRSEDLSMVRLSCYS